MRKQARSGKRRQSIEDGPQPASHCEGKPFERAQSLARARLQNIRRQQKRRVDRGFGKTRAGQSAKPAQSTAATPTDLANRSANADRLPSDALAEKVCPRTTTPPFPRLRNGAQPNRL